MRWIRLLLSLFSSGFRTRLNLSDISSIRFSVWLTDIDVTIMNHAAMMTVFESGRIDYMVRTGFFKLARQKKWYVPISSISVQFFRPLKVFQKAVLTTRVFHMTEHSVFLEQKIMRQGKDIALCIVKSKVKSGREDVATQEIAKLLNNSIVPGESQELIELYESLNEAFKNEFYARKMKVKPDS